MGKDGRGKNGCQGLNRAVFLDRDGVINRAVMREGRPYAPVSFKDFELLPGVEEAARRLHDAGFKLIVVTNQPDVKNGLQAMEDVEAAHRMIRRALPLDDIKVCFHNDSDRCQCRKPKPGMLLEAAKDWSIDLKKSYIVGDTWKDMDAGKAAGCKTIWVRYPGYADREKVKADEVVDSLHEAAKLILGRE